MKFSAFLCVLLLCAGFGRMVYYLVTYINSHPSVSLPRPDMFDKTLVVGAFLDYPPYSFINSDGEWSGYDIELIYNLGWQMNCDIQIHGVQASKAMEYLDNGTVDFLVSYSYTPQRSRKAEFSTPVVSAPYMAFGKAPHVPLAAFNTLKVCSVEGDSIRDAFLEPYKLAVTAAYFKTYTEAFLSVEAGENDLVVAPYTTGRRITATMETNIESFGPVLYNSIYCLAAKKGNTELMEKLESQLALFRTDGTLDKLQEKWLKHYVDVTSISDLLNIHRTAFLILLFVSIILSLVSILAAYLLGKKNELQAVMNEKCFRTLARQSKKVIIEWDFIKNRITAISNFREFFGRDIVTYNAKKEEIFSQIAHPEDVGLFTGAFDDIISGTPDAQTRLRIRDMDGRYNWCRLSGVLVEDKKSRPFKALATLENIDVQVRTEEMLQQKASIDILTGLSNKMSTKLQIDSIIASKPPALSALVCADLDNFKKINDTFGHLFGDEVLVETAATIRSQFRSSDVLGRFGGDEFVFFILQIPNKEFIAEKVSILNRNVYKTFSKEENLLSVSMSIGIALYPQDGTTYEELYKKADIACYQAKSKGKNRWFFYNEYQ